MGTIRQSSQGGMQTKITGVHWRSTILAKKKSCFSIASIVKDYSATRAEWLQNAKHWILRLNADGPQKPLRQRPEFAVALKQCLKMQDAHLAETRQSLGSIRPENQQRQGEDQQFEGGENFDYYVDRKTRWRYYREPRRNPSAASSSSTSQWQDRRVRAHSILQHLRNGGEFGYLEGIPENRRGVWTVHPITEHICGVAYSQRDPHECYTYHASTRGSRTSTAQKCKSSFVSKRDL